MTEPNGSPIEPPPPAPARRRRDRELWVGLFAAAGIVFIVAALFVLTDASMFRGRYLITTTVGDAAGIRRGDPVQLRGVNIGRVKRFDIARDRVVIRLEIEGEYRFPRDSRVTIRSGGLLDGMVAEVIPGASSERIRQGDNLPGVSGPTLTSAAERVATQSAELVQRLRAALSDRTIAGIEASSVGLADLLGNVSGGVTEQRAALLALTTTLNRAAANMERATGPDFQRSIARLDEMTRALSESAPRVERTIASLDRSSRAAEALLDRVERGEGTLGRLSKDDALYRNADRALHNLDRAAVQLGLLSEDIRKNPERYVNLSLF